MTPVICSDTSSLDVDRRRLQNLRQCLTSEIDSKYVGSLYSLSRSIQAELRAGELED
jgi:hypothetical protein